MKGILFKTWQAKLRVLEGKGEAQTRRVIKPQPSPLAEFDHFDVIGQAVFTDGLVAKPRYQEGEVVYVKEVHYRYGRWVKNGLTKMGKQKWLFKSLSDEVRYRENRPEVVYANACKTETGWFARSPLFFPEKFARYFIRMKVKAQRVQEITEEDAILEGINKNATCYIREMGKYTEERTSIPRVAFSWLWDSINPKYPFDNNPWEFTYTFRLEAR